jgi:hypothetical protein
MVEETAPQAEWKTPGITPGQTPMAMCPMATMCKGMMEKPPSGFLVMLAGAVLIVLGLLIFVEPRIVVWLVGSALVLFGVALLMMANFLRRLGAQARSM